jgi:transcriptional regulator with GAF, ATPase, and Fis domain
MDPWDLVDQIIGLVAVEDARALAGRTLDAVLAAVNGRRGALFSREHDRISLFISRGIDQTVLEAVQAAWVRQRDTFLSGRVVVCSTASQEPLPQMRAVLRDAVSVAIAPVLRARSLVGLMFVDSRESRFEDERDIEGLTQFARVASVALTAPAGGAPVNPVGDLESYLELSPVEDIEREQLILLLDRYEWNIARVSRVMGVARQTIYLRLRRYGIERRRIPKAVPRRLAT